MEGWLVFTAILENGIRAICVATPIKYGGGGNISHYLIWDSDTIPLKKLHLFTQNKTCFETSAYIHKPYFDTLERLHIITKDGDHIHRVVDFSFVTENMMVETAKMQELLALIESQYKKPFWEAILENIESRELAYSGFSEFETYGNFIAMMYPNSFVIVERKRERYAREFLGDNPSEKLLQWYARSYDVIGIESWIKEKAFFVKFFQIPCTRLLAPSSYRYILHSYTKIHNRIKKYATRLKKIFKL